LERNSVVLLNFKMDIFKVMHDIVLGGADQYLCRKEVITTLYLCFTARIVGLYFNILNELTSI
jgi:hypothetical protein